MTRDLVHAVDGAAAKAAVGGILTLSLGAIHTLIGIVVGLVTLFYIGSKLYLLWADRKRHDRKD